MAALSHSRNPKTVQYFRKEIYLQIKVFVKFHAKKRTNEKKKGFFYIIKSDLEERVLLSLIILIFIHFYFFCSAAKIHFILIFIWTFLLQSVLFVGGCCSDR
jgi:hypothetical protein